MNPLIRQLKKYGTISEDVQRDIDGRTKYLSKKKDDHLLRAGQSVSSYFVIEKGLIRAYFIRNGKEVNSWFAEEDQIFGSILPVYTDRPSFENLQFMEDSEIFALSADDLNDLYLMHPELNLIGRKIAEEVCVVLEERIMSLHTESALERYQSLIKNQPNVFNRINLGHIASYLGITQETLSRIRKL